MKPMSPFLAAFIKIMAPECSEEHKRGDEMHPAGEAILPPFDSEATIAPEKWQY